MKLTDKQAAIVWYIRRHTELHGKPPGDVTLGRVFRINKSTACAYRRRIRAKGLSV